MGICVYLCKGKNETCVRVCGTAQLREVVLERSLKWLTRSGGRVWVPPVKWARGDASCYQDRRICSLNVLLIKLARIAANARNSPYCYAFLAKFTFTVEILFQNRVNLKLNTWILVSCAGRLRDFIEAPRHEDVWGNRSLAPPFLTSSLDGGEWSASHLCCFTPNKTCDERVYWKRLIV
jgi:hypothetical protein